MIRWEYRIYVFEPRDDVLGKLNQLGAEGWEAFQFFTMDGARTRVLFKRQTTTTGEEK